MVYASYLDNDDPTSLDRSPSLMSRSSGASTPPLTTPSLPSTASFSKANSGSAKENANLWSRDNLNRHGNVVSSSRYRSHPSLTGKGSDDDDDHSTTTTTEPPRPPSRHEKGIFAYQAKVLSRTGSVQSISSNLNSLPRAPTSSNLAHNASPARYTADENGSMPSSASSNVLAAAGSTRAQKRTTWAPGHKSLTGSVSSFDDIKGRFGGKVSSLSTSGLNTIGGGSSGNSSNPGFFDRNTVRPTSPTTASSATPRSPTTSAAAPTTPTWRTHRSSTLSKLNSESSDRPSSPSHRAQQQIYGSPSKTTPYSATVRTYSSTEGVRPPSPTRSPTPHASAPLESEIMRHSVSSTPSGLGHRPKQSSLHLGGMKELGQSSVGAVRNLRAFAMRQDSSATSSPSLERQLTVSGSGGTHRRTRTLPNLDFDASKASSSTSYKSTTNRLNTPDSPRGPGRLNMHGLDRLSERSDGSIEEVSSRSNAPFAGTIESSNFGHSRRMASDAGEDETAAILIPGITVGSDSVAGMNGRLRLARQPTVTKYGNLPSHTMKALDNQRQNLQAYEYLCHVSEAKEWLISCLSDHPLEPDLMSPTPMSPTATTSPYVGSPDLGDESDPSGLSNKSIVELEEALRNGVALARLARAFMGKKAVPRIFTASRPKFRHSDNINYFFQFTQHVGLPEIFCFELTDLYDAKNLPKVIYCIHALSHLLARRGMAEKIGNLVGKIDFTDEELTNKQKGLDAAGVAMPSFGNIGRQLAKEINEEPEPEPEPEETEEEIRARLLQDAEPSIVTFQALLRGHLARQAYETKQDRLQRATRTYIALQAQCRGKIAHTRMQAAMLERQQMLSRSTRFVTKFQAHARKVLVQRAFYSSIAQLDNHDGAMTGLQAIIRGKLIRDRHNHLLFQISEGVEAVIGFQARARGMLARKLLLGRIKRLRAAEAQVSTLQSLIRGVLARKAQAKVAQDMRKVEVVRSVGNVQAFARGALMRKRQQQQSKALGFVLPDVVGVQAQIRGFLARKRLWSWYNYLHSSHDEATRLQSLLRGAVARRKLYTKLVHYHHNMDKVVKVQALFRKKQQLDSYRQLTKGTNVPLATVKNFIHLLSDNDTDYKEEMVVKELKEKVVTKIRENQQLEADVSDLDIKIALLVKNKMSLDEVERARRGNHGTLGQKQRNSVLAAAKDPFALASMDKATLRKLELYQQMFYLLQTKPEYLARLFFRLSRIEMGDRARKAVEGVVLTLFGYAQNSREEFLLLKLFQRSIHEEVMAISTLQDFVKGDFVFIKLVVQYGRGAKERKFLQDTLAPLIDEVVQDSGLELETDPLAIYRACIAKEEMETGLTSSRPIEGVDHTKALEDPEVRTIFIRHLQLLRAKTDRFLGGIFASTARMPFGMRYIAREIFRALEVKFANESKESLIRVVGHFLYYRYINPAVVAPEGFDVVSSTIGPAQRKNLAAISKMLNQISVGRQFADENPYLAPLNEYVSYGTQRFRDWFFSVLDVPDAEIQFNADEYLDHSLPHKPIIYISPNEIYSMHTLILQHLEAITEGNHDPLRVLLSELGGAPLQASAELDQARAGQIEMTLKGKFETVDDPQGESKALFAATKRYVLYLLKVQPAANLLQALVEEVLPVHEEAWAMVLREEFAINRAHAAANRTPNLNASIEDVRNLSFRQLKARCLENMLELEKLGRVERSDNFQAILNAIATDIRNKHRKRLVRQREIQTMTGTIVNLDEKHKYLEQQIEAFRSFVDSTKTTIQKKGKKRMVIPFSAQYFHNRELARTGRVPKFGSYKYTAKNLADRGILLSIEGFYDNIALTISSDEVGVFLVEATMMGVPVPDGQVELSMDELLQAQFNAKQTLNLGGMAKCNLNLLLSLINKKFYS